MKRRFLRSVKAVNDIPSDLADYVTELQLLYYVPLSYIVADEILLPPESLRFFYVDGNWTEALADGALSIGRVTAADSTRDKNDLDAALPRSRASLHVPRHSRMHISHRAKARKVFEARGKANGGKTNGGITTDGITTGFVMRSELVRMLKGLEVSAYNGETELAMLRLGTFSGDIALGLFDGDITSLVIAEPKTGLTFGLATGEHDLVPKDVTEANLGIPLRDKCVDINDYKNAAGRLDVSGLAEELGKRLDTEIGAAKLAFELIAVANRAVFENEKE